VAQWIDTFRRPIDRRRVFLLLFSGNQKPASRSAAISRGGSLFATPPYAFGRTLLSIVRKASRWGAMVLLAPVALKNQGPPGPSTTAP
jgi:hypothetical protein